MWDGAEECDIKLAGLPLLCRYWVEGADPSVGIFESYVSEFKLYFQPKFRRLPDGTTKMGKLYEFKRPLTPDERDEVIFEIRDASAPYWSRRPYRRGL